MTTSRDWDSCIPISDEDLEKDPYLPPYFHPGMEDPAIQYMMERRAKLGGPVPSRRTFASHPFKIDRVELGP